MEITLKELFKLQSTLNKKVGLNEEIFRIAFAFSEAAKKTTHKYHYEKCLKEAGQWIDDMLKALSSEIEELRNCTFWKHWCKEAQDGDRYKLKDVSAARKEVIDILHFWISLAQILGMDAKLVGDMYKAKLAQNIKRQDEGYSIIEKEKAWQIFQDRPHNLELKEKAKSLEDLDADVQWHYLRIAREELYAWQIFKTYNPKSLAKSLDELEESVRLFFIQIATKILEAKNPPGELPCGYKICQHPEFMANIGCQSCSLHIGHENPPCIFCGWAMGEKEGLPLCPNCNRG